MATAQQALNTVAQWAQAHPFTVDVGGMLLAWALVSGAMLVWAVKAEGKLAQLRNGRGW